MKERIRIVNLLNGKEKSKKMLVAFSCQHSSENASSLAALGLLKLSH